MTSLREIQMQMGCALLERELFDLPGLFADDASADVGFDVHRTNVVASLTAALQDTFPVVCRLVDERFFAYAAHEFICASPPVTPIVADYGAGFPDFLAQFPPCRELVYLADVARLEWAIDHAARAPDGSSPILVESPWPIGRIWQGNQPDAPDQTIDLDSGGARLAVQRIGNIIELKGVP